jgi:RND family efflux transporter MFP subunit
MTTPPPDLSELRIRRDAPARSEPRSRGRLLLVLLPLLVVAAGATYVLTRSRPVEVRVATATASGGGSVSATGITASGYVVARTKASVSAKIPGRMEYLGVTEGSRVRRGQVMARIESRDYQAALAAARSAVLEVDAQLAQARRDLERAERLERERVLSKADLENAASRVQVLEAQRQSARAGRQLAEANLENTLVRAPFDGTVLRKDAEVGEIVAPASAGGGLTRTAIVTMADLATLEVEVDVNEAYIAQIGNGQSARITLDAYPDTSFAGRVRQVVPTADRQKATVQVKVSILDRDPRILPEMGAKVEFTRESGAQAAAPTRRRVVVPSAAVVQSGGASRVWIVSEQKVSARPVEVGATHGDQVEVRSGLQGGETVVVAPPAGLEDGARVRVAGG